MNQHLRRNDRRAAIRLATVRLAFVAGIAPVAACSSGATTPSTYVPPAQTLSAAQSGASAAPEGESVDTSRAVTASTTAALPAAAASRQLMYDDFESDRIGLLPAGWTSLSGSWQACKPQGHSTEFCQSSIAGSVAHPTVAGQASWADYAVDSEAVRDADVNHAGGIMLMGRVVDSSHFYALELRSDIGGSGREFWYIHRHDEHGWTELTGGPFTTAANPYYRLRLSFTGNRISAYVAYNYSTAFQPLGSVTDASFARGGIALRTWNNGSERFDDVRVTTAADAGSPSPIVPTSTPQPGTPVPTAVPTSVPTAPPTPAPTAKPTAAPTAVPSAAPTTVPGNRSMMFDSSAGSAYEQTSTSYGEIQPPTFSGHAPTCTNADYPTCSGQSGAATFHITRSSLAAQEPGGSWRSMQTLLPHPLEPNAMYDVAFRTTTNSPQDVPGSQNLIFQVHPSPGNVNTALGLENDGTNGTYWYFEAGGVLGLGANTPYGRHRSWEAPYVVGETDDWEVQFKNTADSSGFAYLYRNGVLVDKYDGPNVVPTTAYTELGWGIYEYHWATGTASSALSEEITFQNMKIYKIPGPVPQVTSF